jgi:RecB family exonuclease
MQRGTDIHQTCEDFVAGTSPTLHPAISPAWAMQIRALKELGAVPEQQWEFEEGWHLKAGGPLWLRMKIDVHYRTGNQSLTIIDYKTGKPYLANMEQLEVYALGGFATFEDVNIINGELWYLDHDEPHEKTFRREDAPKLARKWEQRAARLLEAENYPARKNKFCDWCPYNFKKGGPCTAAP